MHNEFDNSIILLFNDDRKKSTLTYESTDEYILGERRVHIMVH